MDKYKQYCVGPYEEWDVIEVLVGLDVDDWYRYEEETRYFLVGSTYLYLLNIFNRNTTGEILELNVAKTTNEKVPFWNILWDQEFDSSYIVAHRKIEVVPHAGWKPKTVERYKIDFIIHS
jgi:hypothetical protein